VIVHLTDGTALEVRPIRPSDKEALAAGHVRLSPESVQKRFLSAKPTLSRAELRYLTEVDGDVHHALVAVDPSHPDEIVAVGRYVRLPGDPATADAAIVVCDDMQGKGLGKQLAVMLADAARAHGVTRFSADIMSDNEPALKLMQTIDSRLTDGGHDHGVHSVIASLAA
jgi:GNAT superfamily N-acetyltransferase